MPSARWLSVRVRHSLVATVCSVVFTGAQPARIDAACDRLETRRWSMPRHCRASQTLIDSLRFIAAAAAAAALPPSALRHHRPRPHAATDPIVEARQQTATPADPASIECCSSFCPLA